MGPILLGALVLFGTMIAGRVVREGSLRLLTQEQKARLVDAFARSRIVYPAVALGNIGLFLVMDAAGVPLRIAYFGGLMAPWLIFLGWTHVAIVKRLRRLDLPEGYVKAFQRARLLSYAGVGVFLACLIVTIAPGGGR